MSADMKHRGGIRLMSLSGFRRISWRGRQREKRDYCLQEWCLVVRIKEVCRLQRWNYVGEAGTGQCVLQGDCWLQVNIGYKRWRDLPTPDLEATIFKVYKIFLLIFRYGKMSGGNSSLSLRKQLFGITSKLTVLVYLIFPVCCVCVSFI